MLCRFTSVLFALLGFLPAHAAEWRDAELPAYANGVEFIAIGSDGFLYQIESNPNGYVFRSLSDKYGFEAGADRFTVRILAGQDVYYLGTSCEAAHDKDSGTWSRDSTGLNYAVELKNGPRMIFRALDTDIEPGHSC